jgi:hypothetical protein
MLMRSRRIACGCACYCARGRVGALTERTQGGRLAGAVSQLLRGRHKVVVVVVAAAAPAISEAPGKGWGLLQV